MLSKFQKRPMTYGPSKFLIDGKPGGRTLNVVWLVEPRNRDARQPAPRAKAQIAALASPLLPSASPKCRA